ncbi:neurofilament heavy polypeptide isoform X2 [Anabrus simplex]|uniref:neurofilament heavy polypeptide isoform X2 n=1 Tax=Anabrus simplex TaxID=316456 RepID=UPI0035A3D4A6
MSASAVKPVHPTAGNQAPKVGSGPPAPGPGNSPPISATGGAKLQPNVTGSPVKPAVPANPNTNHAVAPTIPVSLVQDHKATASVLAQPQVPLQRSPEKNKDLAVGPPVVSKPTSNGVEGSESTSPSNVTDAPVEANPEEGSELLPAVQNHAENAPLPDTQVQQLGVVSTTVAEIPPQMAVGSQPSPTKAENSSPTTGSVNNPPFGNLNNVGESGLDVLNSSSPELAAPELVPAISPVNVPQLPTSTTDASPTPTSVSQPFVQDTPPKLTPVQVDANKPRTDVPKPEFKVATPPRNSKRKKETKLATEVKELNVDHNIESKSKRQRTRTQPYQSPLPQLTYMTKFKPAEKSDGHDKLIVFYKNEFLAVRNVESGFYVCQAVQNIYKSSARIRIRWLSQEKKDGRLTEVYIPDFYDVTDFDCILTNLDLKKIDKNKYQLPTEERDRTLSILNRALDVEKGVTETPPVTEEHPDGLDLSLYKDEAQLKKRGQPKKPVKKSSLTSSESADESGENPEEVSADSENDTKKKPKAKTNKKVDKSKSPAKEKVKTKEKDPTKTERNSERDRGRDRGLTIKRRSESLSRSSVVKPPPEKKTKLASEKKAKTTLPKSTRKSVTVSVTSENPIPTRSTKSRSK